MKPTHDDIIEAKEVYSHLSYGRYKGKLMLRKSVSTYCLPVVALGPTLILRLLAIFIANIWSSFEPVYEFWYLLHCRAIKTQASLYNCLDYHIRYVSIVVKLCHKYKNLSVLIGQFHMGLNTRKSVFQIGGLGTTKAQTSLHIPAV